MCQIVVRVISSEPAYLLQPVLMDGAFSYAEVSCQKAELLPSRPRSKQGPKPPTPPKKKIHSVLSKLLDSFQPNVVIRVHHHKPECHDEGLDCSLQRSIYVVTSGLRSLKSTLPCRHFGQPNLLWLNFITNMGVRSSESDFINRTFLVDL